MSLNSFSALWEQSKREHHANVLARRDSFRHDFEKTWSLLLRPSFYPQLLLFLIPVYWRRFVAERQRVRSEVRAILGHYAPLIREQLVLWQEGFNEWEEGNRGPALCGSSSALSKEQCAREETRRLSQQMVEKVGAVGNYGLHFHPIINPATMVENPYPGYFSSERAQKYCEMLGATF